MHWVSKSKYLLSIPEYWQIGYQAKPLQRSWSTIWLFCILLLDDALTDITTSRLDQEAAIEEDEANFDPDEEIRDYDALARNLPVFCVSSRVFRKLSARLENDTVRTDGFKSLNDTEIPQLQEHARILTETRRVTTCRLFLNELNQLLNSMKLSDARDTWFTASQKKLNVDEKVLHKLLSGLDIVGD